MYKRQVNAALESEAAAAAAGEIRDIGSLLCEDALGAILRSGFIAEGFDVCPPPMVTLFEGLSVHSPRQTAECQNVIFYCY